MAHMDGQTLRALRHKAGLTQTQLAEAAFVGVNTLAGCEVGKRELRADTMRKVCKTLGVTVTYTMGDLVITQPPG